MTRSKKRDELNENDLISSLPLDLMIQILARLPMRSISQLIFVSKRWSSIVRGKDLTDLFVSRSLARPSLLLTFGTPSIRGFHCCSQEDPSCGNRRTTITPNPIFDLSPPIRGLICGQEISDNASKVICNPTTGQFLTLPRVKTKRRHPDFIPSLLGYDPVNHLYKVLSMTVRYLPRQHEDGPVLSQEHQVFTLGATRKTWRIIQCKHPHCPATNSLCRDGVIYYGAWYNSHEEGSLIMSFDVRSEDFAVTKLPGHVKIRHYSQTSLVKYQETIALVDHTYTGKVDLWVLLDVEKQEWSKISVLLPSIDGTIVFYCRGTISTGELIFAPSWFAIPYFLLYYNLKGNNARRVEIQGVRDSVGPVIAYLDHVESLMFL